MAITNIDTLINALGNNYSRFLISKPSITTTAANYCSLWRATGTPAQGAIPTAAAVCNTNTVGAVGFTAQVAPTKAYLAWQVATIVNVPSALEMHDRLVHMGGLSGTVTTAQNVTIDLNSLLATDNISARIGDANYSDVTWWLEWYTSTGSTASTATVNVTYNDGTTGNLSAISLAATRPASLAISLNAFIPALTPQKFIRGVNTVTLSPSTGTAGNFGITATRSRAYLPFYISNKTEVGDWQLLGLPEIFNSSCLFPMIYTGSTSTSVVSGQGKIIYG
jgi:hypothetical protein